MKVLIVDDSRSVQKMIAWRLQKVGFEVVGVGNDGREGLELFQKLKPELMLLDITMPNMDGRECLKGVLQANPQATVVMISAIGTPEVVQECLAIGAKGFIEKQLLMKPGYLEECLGKYAGKKIIPNAA